MPYVERITEAGKIIYCDKYHTMKYQSKEGSRGQRQKPTREQMKKANQRARVRKLEMEIAANFEDGDYHINFGYIRKKGEPYRTKEQMQKDIRKLKEILRKEYRKQGLEFKYIHVMEIGERGSRHHHMIINRIDTKILQDAWKKACPEGGTIHIAPLYSDGDYGKLAEYLIKDTSKKLGTEEALQGKSWCSSKNLKKPKVTKRIISRSDTFRTDPKPRKGYYIVKESIRSSRLGGDPEYNGYDYLTYKMVRLE